MSLWKNNYTFITNKADCQIAISEYWSFFEAINNCLWNTLTLFLHTLCKSACKMAAFTTHVTLLDTSWFP